MDKNAQWTKQIFEIISSLKKTGFNNSTITELRPSEEMFLMKINMIDNKNVKVSDIVCKLNLAPSTVSTILKALEDSNYIVRKKNSDNGREVLVDITDIGLLRVKKIKEVHFDKIKKLIEYLGEDDAKRLIEILKKTAYFFMKDGE